MCLCDIIDWMILWPTAYTAGVKTPTCECFVLYWFRKSSSACYAPGVMFHWWDQQFLLCIQLALNKDRGNLCFVHHQLILEHFNRLKIVVSLISWIVLQFHATEPHKCGIGAYWWWLMLPRAYSYKQRWGAGYRGLVRSFPSPHSQVNWTHTYIYINIYI